MPMKRYKPEQIVALLRRIEVEMGEREDHSTSLQRVTSATLTAMFYYLHLLLLAPLYSLVSSLLLRDQDREILLLRQQLLIMQRQLGRKPAYGRPEKLALLLATLRLSKRRLAAALLIARPDTLLRWHGELVRRHWTFRKKRRPGRPPVTAPRALLCSLR